MTAPAAQGARDGAGGPFAFASLPSPLCARLQPDLSFPQASRRRQCGHCLLIPRGLRLAHHHAVTAQHAAVHTASAPRQRATTR
jgi:hypothetical protein